MGCGYRGGAVAEIHDPVMAKEGDTNCVRSYGMRKVGRK